MLYAHYAQIQNLEERQDIINNIAAGHPHTDDKSFLNSLDEGIRRLGIFRPEEGEEIEEKEGKFPWQE